MDLDLTRTPNIHKTTTVFFTVVNKIMGLIFISTVQGEFYVIYNINMY